MNGVYKRYGRNNVSVRYNSTIHKICNMKFGKTLTDCWAEGANAAAPAARVAITASFILILFI